jgi:hypothetical protein
MGIDISNKVPVVADVDGTAREIKTGKVDLWLSPPGISRELHAGHESTSTNNEDGLGLDAAKMMTDKGLRSSWRGRNQ